jgi:hypothetical protein
MPRVFKGVILSVAKDPLSHSGEILRCAQDDVGR